MELAEMVNEFLKEHDYFEYVNNDMTKEKVERSLKEEPLAVIKYLLEIIEELKGEM